MPTLLTVETADEAAHEATDAILNEMIQKAAELIPAFKTSYDMTKPVLVSNITVDIYDDGSTHQKNAISITYPNSPDYVDPFETAQRIIGEMFIKSIMEQIGSGK